TASNDSYDPVMSNARPMIIGPIAPASAYAVHVKPKSVENDPGPKDRERGDGVTSASPPTPKPISMAASAPAASECAHESTKVPSAAAISSAKATRPAKNRSSSHPVTMRPRRLAPPIAESAIAAPDAGTP